MKNMKFVLALALSLLFLGANAQSSLEEITANPAKAGGVYQSSRISLSHF